MNAFHMVMIAGAWLVWEVTGTVPHIVKPGIVNRAVGVAGIGFSALIVWLGVLTVGTLW